MIVHPVDQPEWSAQRRFIFCAVAFVGSTAYAASFAPLGLPSAVKYAACVGAAAAASWLLFGATLLAATRGMPSVLSWMDACLAAIAWGMLIKMVAVATNLAIATAQVSSAPLGLHLSILLLADAVMGIVFCRQAQRRDVGTGSAVLLWLALNAYFAGVLFALLRLGGLS
jgi:hypothetical protein